ncbi:MAG: type II toxin-antitoxin system HipA family toxin, partial [Rhodoferax sp.]|nr:type II toxin-antitoxin system HipA family toxin [Rhodoferax sp.]
IDPAGQRALVDRVCTGVASVVPELMQHIRNTAGFAPVGQRMLWEWNEGMKRLTERRTFALPDWVAEAEASGLERPAPAPRLATPRIGESPLLAPNKPRRRAVLPPS